MWYDFAVMVFVIWNIIFDALKVKKRPGQEWQLRKKTRINGFEPDKSHNIWCHNIFWCALKRVIKIGRLKYLVLKQVLDGTNPKTFYLKILRC